ncbi:MAG: NADH-quinone oxidoreductase subunit K [Anaerolineae bacterium]|nr:NADH-quinone oxidoreductase subunit K [Anaerolineae bacterium]
MTVSVAVASVCAVFGLVGIGFYGLMMSRNLIKAVVALQIAVKGVLVAMVLAGKLNSQLAVAQSMALTVLVADTIVAVLGLALAVQIRRHFGSLDTTEISTLRK